MTEIMNDEQLDTSVGDIDARIQSLMSMTKSQFNLNKGEVNNVLAAAQFEIRRLREIIFKGIISKNGAIRAAAKWRSCDEGKWPAVRVFPRVLKTDELLRKVALGYEDSRGAFQAIVFLWFKDTDAPVRIKDRRAIRGSWPSAAEDNIKELCE